MAFAQGKFGIEYNPNPIDEESSGAGWLVAVIVLAAIAVLAAAGGEAGWANCRRSGAKRLTTSVYSLFMSPPAPVMSRAAVQSGSRRIPRSTCSVPTR